MMVKYCDRKGKRRKSVYHLPEAPQVWRSLKDTKRE